MLFELMLTIFTGDGPSEDNVGSTVHIFTEIVHDDVPE
jgi:hypothetical protein